MQYLSVLNHGKQPTLPSGELTVGAHMLDFDGDIYGEIVHVKYIKFMRNERKFVTTDELIQQLNVDEQEARMYIKSL